MTLTLIERITERVQAKHNDSPMYRLHPDLQHRVPFYVSTEGEETSNFDGNAKLYKTNTWVHKALGEWRKGISRLRLTVMRGSGDEAQEVENHALVPVLESPNPSMSSDDLWGEWAVDMGLGGEQGIEVVRTKSGDRILELWPRQPQIFTVQPAEGGRRYRKVLRYKIDDDDGPEYFLKPEQFIHFKFYNPTNPWRGIAPITAVRTGVLIDQLAQAWSKAFFTNSARPDYAVISPEGLTESERETIEIKLMEKFGGSQHRPIVLEQGITDIKTFSFPPKDMEWLAQREMARDEIAAIFGVPDEIMGYGRDTYENFDTADRVFVTNTIAPLVEFRDGVLTHFFRRVGVLGADERIETDLTVLPQLQEDKSGKVQQYRDLVASLVAPNMANELVGLGLPDMPWGNIAYVPLGTVPVGTPRPEPGQPTRGARMQNKAAAPEYGSAVHEATWKASQRKINPFVVQLQRAMKRFFQEQQNDVARKLRNSRELGRGQFKDKIDKLSVQELFSLDYWITQLKELITPFIADAVGGIGQGELDSLGVDIEFNMDSDLVQRGIDYIAQQVAGKVNKTTYDGILSLLQDAETAGEGIPAIQERLSAFFGDRKSDFETERIARTTMTGAANFASEEAWDESEVVGGKTWISALLPNRTRPEHAEAHGQTVPLHGMFSVGGESLEFPGDPAGDPGNIINCLCTMVAELRE